MDSAPSPAPPPFIEDALGVIRDHPSVISAEITLEAKTGVWSISAEIDANLPSRAYGDGISKTGVKRSEPVTFRFPSVFPRAAPGIYLRADFPRNLAHIQPGRPGSAVEPCTFFGDRTDLMHRRGFEALVEHLVTWIQNAACDELIKREQGWEPIRRDVCADVVEFNWDDLVRHVGPDAGALTFLSALIRKPDDGGEPAYYGIVGTRPVDVALQGDWINPEKPDESPHTIAFLAWSDGPPHANPRIASEYAPDTVTTLAELLAAAETYGCAEPLRDALARFDRTCAKGRKGQLPIVVILCARRPTKVINTSSPLELIPYVLHAEMPSSLGHQATTRVTPASHRHKIGRAILLAMSGLPAHLSQREMTVLGCGSLGSKLSIHLARAGVAPTRLVDKSWMSPHNAARHGLLPGPEMCQPEWHGGKAGTLARAIDSFGFKTTAVARNITLVAPASPLFDQIYGGAEIVLNTTGSAAVRSEISHAAFDGRVIEASLLERGQFGLMTIEGSGRSPRTDDLAAEAFQIMATRPELRAALRPQEAAAIAPVGLSCASLTMVMPDSLLSLQAAAMGQRLLRVASDGIPDAAEVLISRVGADGMSLEWISATVPPFHLVTPENAPDWSVRVSDAVHKKIIADIGRYPRIETGGVAIGRVSVLDQTIWITDVLDAPPDSVRSASEFRLGVRGIPEKLDEIDRDSGGTLGCAGTWHSHLADQGGSDRDYATATELGAVRPKPQVLLIRRPLGYSAVLARKKM